MLCRRCGGAARMLDAVHLECPYCGQRDQLLGDVALRNIDLRARLEAARAAQAQLDGFTLAMARMFEQRGGALRGLLPLTAVFGAIFAGNMHGVLSAASAAPESLRACLVANGMAASSLLWAAPLGLAAGVSLARWRYRATVRPWLLARAPVAEGAPARCRVCGASIPAVRGEVFATCRHCHTQNILVGEVSQDRARRLADERRFHRDRVVNASAAVSGDKGNQRTTSSRPSPRRPAPASHTGSSVYSRCTARSVAGVLPLASGVTPDPAITAMLAPYRARLAAIFDAPVGVATSVFPRGGNVERLGEVAVGNLVADAMRLRYGVQVALTNGGGLRSPASVERSARRPLAPPHDAGLRRGTPYDLVVGDVYTLLPFGNAVVTRTVTGAQLDAALENGVSHMPGADGRFPQISGFRFTYNASLPAGSRVVSVTLDDNTAVAADATTYTFATNDFVNAGGDGYTALADRQGVTREVMADFVLAYVRALGTTTPTISGRITRLP